MLFAVQLAFAFCDPRIDVEVYLGTESERFLDAGGRLCDHLTFSDLIPPPHKPRECRQTKHMVMVPLRRNVPKVKTTTYSDDGQF